MPTAAAAAADDDVSSPRPHKDRALKRKTKSKSKSKSKSAVKRLRRDESASSDDSRIRRKSSKRQKRSPSRERKKRKKGKKKSRKLKVRRYSSSDSGSSCSTCRGGSGSDRSRSKSPVRKVKKVRGRSSVRDKSKRRRGRSPSCSTCSGASRSRSPVKNARIKVSDDERGRVRVKRSNADDMDDVRLEKKVRVDEAVDVRLNNDRGEVDSFEERVLPSGVDSFEEGQVLSPMVNGGNGGFMENRFEGKDSVFDVYSMPPEDYDRYDPGESDSDSNRDRLASSNNEVVPGTSSLETEDLEMILRQKALENFRKFRGGVVPRSGSIAEGKAEAKDGHTSIIDSIKSSDCKPASSLNTYPQGGGRLMVDNQSFSNNDVTSKLVDDQKISISSNNQNTHKVKNVHESLDNMSSEQSLLPKGSHTLIKCNPSSSIDNLRRIDTPDRSIKNDDKSVPVPVVSNADSKTTTTKFLGASDNRITTDGLTSKHKSSGQVSSDQSSLIKDNEEERPVAVPIRGAIPSPEANLANGAASGSFCSNSVNVDCKPSEAFAAPKTGDQFEQKTFSRMRDGETVQVKYKVYIPKKSSTFTRRPLQR